MSTRPVHGVCIVRATADGAGVHFSVVSSLDAESDTEARHEAFRHDAEVLAEVGSFLRVFIGRHAR